LVKPVDAVPEYPNVEEKFDALLNWVELRDAEPDNPVDD